ncbi:MAG: TRAP transporter large permease [Oscillospiraceae bacterium]
MSDGVILVIIFGIMLFAMFMGTPVFTSIGITAIIAMLLWMRPQIIAQFGVIAYTQGTSFNQVIAPMFIMMSEFLSSGGIAEDIYAVLNRAVGKFKGGLAIATTLACTIFAALCGSSPATAASIGRISIKEMEKRGYDQGFAVGTVAAGGTLGIMIPPSITFCLYGIVTETSIVQLFMAGVIPGLFLSSLLIVSIIIRGSLKPSLVGAARGGKGGADMDAATAREIVEAAKAEALKETGAPAEDPVTVKTKKGPNFWTILPALILIVIVLGSMYTGLATPLEAAGYGVLGSILIVLCQRRMNKKLFNTCMLNTARTGTMMIFLMICGFCLTFAVSYLGIATTIANAIINSGMGKIGIIILMYLLWFVLGCLMDPASMVILTVPFLFETLMAFGFHRLWVGVVSVLACQIAMITPPVGMNLFVLKANSDVPMSKIMSGCVPYVIIMILGLIILTIFPGMTTWLPSLMYNIY